VRSVTFLVAGTPKAQPRLRPLMRRDGRLAVHMPTTAEGWRLRVMLEARAALSVPLTGALSVDMHFHLARPKARKAARWPTGKPDLDNLAKSTADALNGTLWADDASIVDWRVRKAYVFGDDGIEGCTITARELP